MQSSGVTGPNRGADATSSHNQDGFARAAYQMNSWNFGIASTGLWL